MKYEYLEVILLRNGDNNDLNSFDEKIIDFKPYFVAEPEETYRIKVKLFPSEKLKEMVEFVAIIVNIDGKGIGYSKY